MTSNESILDPGNSVLIVDDNPQYARILRMMLERTVGFHNVVSVDSTDKGLELLEAEPGRFRLLFVDFHFPDGSTGGQLLERLQSRGLLKDTKAFLITSEPSINNVKQARAAGALGVVAKPFDSVELKRQLEKAERVRILDQGEEF